MICLPPEHLDTFKKALISGKINPEKMANMTSEARHKMLSGIVGEGNAKTVNSLFESKLLLKNQQRGYLTWAKTVAGLKPEVRRTLEAKIAKMDRVLNPTEEQAFLKDLVSTRLGTDVSIHEARKIAKLSSAIQEAETLPRTSKKASLVNGWKLTANDTTYGRARYDFHQYMSDVTHNAEKFRLVDLKGKTAIQAVPLVAKGVADISKSLGASLDNSFSLRQGSKLFWSDHSLWRKQFISSFANLVKGAKNPEAAKRELGARLMGDPYYDQAIKDGLRIKGNEDVFPSSAPEKIPVAGRLFSASEIAYNAFAEHSRLGEYRQMMKIAEDLGGSPPANYGKNMAHMVNSLTGAGGLGKAEGLSGTLNIAFYSARFLKSNIDTLLLHPIGGGGTGGTLEFALRKEGSQAFSAAQKRAVLNLSKIIVGTAGILAAAKAIDPNSVDFDPRSSNFGKIKVKNTRFDITGGQSSLIVLASQLASSSTKSSTTGLITKINTGEYGADDSTDVLKTFLTNKLSPTGQVALDYGIKQDRSGNKPTAKGEAGNLVTPLLYKNYKELHDDPHSANDLTAVLADFFGISTNTYGHTKRNAAKLTGAEQTGFKNHVGENKFNQANEQYGRDYDNWFMDIQKQEGWKQLPDETKRDKMTTAKGIIQKNIYKQYGYKPESTKHKKDKSFLPTKR